VEVQLHSFLTPALDGGEWSPSRPGQFYPREGTQVHIERKAAWAPLPVWSLSRREKIRCLCREPNPVCSGPQSTTHDSPYLCSVNVTKYKQKGRRHKKKLFKIRPNVAVQEMLHKQLSCISIYCCYWEGNVAEYEMLQNMKYLI
jgi:hypothetical protein